MLDESIKTTGFRSIKLIEEPVEEADQYGKGTSFLFEVNGVRVFIGGKCISAPSARMQADDDVRVQLDSS